MAEKLTVAEAAKYARRHPVTLRRALESGELHGAQPKAGARWTIEEACIDAYLEGGLCAHRQNVTRMRTTRRAS